MGYKVTSLLVQAHKADGSYEHKYEGEFLPADVDETQLGQLIDSGMVAEADAPSEDGKPSARAGVKAWRAYAVAQGMSEEDAEALSRDDLRDLYPD